MDDQRFLPRPQLEALLAALRNDGYRVIGPLVREGAIQYADLAGAGALPRGWTDDQAPGRYRLSEVESPRCFAWANGPQALKPYLFAARETLWEVQRAPDGRWVVRTAVGPPPGVLHRPGAGRRRPHRRGPQIAK